MLQSPHQYLSPGVQEVSALQEGDGYGMGW
jgi:hypothetical protein